MTANEIAEQAITRLNRRITNDIFLIIQNDRELMQEYLVQVHSKGVGEVNREIGKAVKNAYSLVNANEREDNPSCTLIQSHQIFE